MTYKILLYKNERSSKPHKRHKIEDLGELAHLLDELGGQVKIALDTEKPTNILITLDYKETP